MQDYIVALIKIIYQNRDTIVYTHGTIHSKLNIDHFTKITYKVIKGKAWSSIKPQNKFIFEILVHAQYCLKLKI